MPHRSAVGTSTCRVCFFPEAFGIGDPDDFPEMMAAMPRLEEKIATRIGLLLPFGRANKSLEIAGTPKTVKAKIQLKLTAFCIYLKTDLQL